MLSRQKDILLEIGNTRAHIYLPHSNKIQHLAIEQAFEKYSKDTIKYISVNNRYSGQLENQSNWTDISNLLQIDGEYETMGADRKALCLSKGDALYVDAGSAITVDRVIDGKYDGGFILLGKKASLDAYSNISKSLEIKLNKDINLNKLAFDTQSSISYGIISPIIDAINKASNSLPIYFTGGDGEWLCTYFKDALYFENLLFVGMHNAISSSKGQI